VRKSEPDGCEGQRCRREDRTDHGEAQQPVLGDDLRTELSDEAVFEQLQTVRELIAACGHPSPAAAAELAGVDAGGT
jgi:hypothetical protein